MKNEPPRRVSAAGLKAPAKKPAAPPAVPMRTSAAGLTAPGQSRVPKPAPAACEPLRTERERSALFDRLRALRDSLTTAVNKNDRAVALISACIMGGICTKPNIVSAMVYLGFNNVHAGATLDRHTGLNPGASRWSKGPDGRYRMLE